MTERSKVIRNGDRIKIICAYPSASGFRSQLVRTIGKSMAETTSMSLLECGNVLITSSYRYFRGFFGRVVHFALNTEKPQVSESLLQNAFAFRTTIKIGKWVSVACLSC
jgi:hypothetical protein